MLPYHASNRVQQNLMTRQVSDFFHLPCNGREGEELVAVASWAMFYCFAMQQVINWEAGAPLSEAVSEFKRLASGLYILPPDSGQEIHSLKITASSYWKSQSERERFHFSRGTAGECSSRSRWLDTVAHQPDHTTWHGQEPFQAGQALP